MLRRGGQAGAARPIGVPHVDVRPTVTHEGDPGPVGDQVGARSILSPFGQVGQSGTVGVDHVDPHAAGRILADRGERAAAREEQRQDDRKQPRDVTAHSDLVARSAAIGGDRASKSTGAGAPQGRQSGHHGQLPAGGRRHFGLGRARGEGEREAGAPPLGAARRVDS